MSDVEKDYQALRAFRLNSSIYEGYSEICSAFDSYQLKGKTIDKVILLGMESHADNFWDDDVPLTCCLNEPVVIVFSDGTNLAIQMLTYDSLRMGVNTIPSSIKHGINHSTLDGGRLFSGIRGFRINGCLCLEQTTNRFSAKGSFSDNSSFYFIIWLENRSIGLSFSRDHGCEFNFSLLNYDTLTPVTIPKKRFMDASTEYSEAIIYGGGNFYGSLNVYAYSNKPEDLDDESSIIKGYGFGIESKFYADKILGYFLRKHYDKTLNNGAASFSCEKACFFTADAFKSVVDEMQYVANEMKKDYSFFYEFFSKKKIEIDGEMHVLSAENSSILIDFIERICFLISEILTDTAVAYFLTC